MTNTQKTIAAEVESKGFAIIDLRKTPSGERTARAMWSQNGYSYLSSGRLVAISKTSVGARMAHNFASNRARIAKFDYFSQDPTLHVSAYALRAMLEGSL